MRRSQGVVARVTIGLPGVYALEGSLAAIARLWRTSRWLTLALSRVADEEIYIQQVRSKSLCSLLNQIVIFLGGRSIPVFSNRLKSSSVTRSYNLSIHLSSYFDMVSNKKRLYIALYPSGVINNEERRSVWLPPPRPSPLLSIKTINTSEIPLGLPRGPQNREEGRSPRHAVPR